MEQDNSCLSHCSMASNTESNLSPGDSHVLLHALDKVGTATASSSPALNSGTGLFHVFHCKLQFGEQDLRISCTSQGLQSPAWLCPAQRIPGGFGLEKSIQCHALPRAGTILLSQVSPSPSRPWIDPFKLPSSPPASHHTHGIHKSLSHHESIRKFPDLKQNPNPTITASPPTEKPEFFPKIPQIQLQAAGTPRHSMGVFLQP